MDPVEVLITQGYLPNVAQQMVDLGLYDQMQNQLPLLPNLTGNVGSETGEQVPLELQPYIDQGYNLEEAAQLAASQNYSLDNQTTPTDEAKKLLNTTEGAGTVNQNQGDSGELLGNVLATAGTGISLEEAAYGLGESIGAEKGPAKTLGIIGNAGKLTLGLARNIGSGLGRMKRDQYVQDYYEETARKAKRDNYTPAPQAGNVNYLGGQSYGEEGGIKGETLPLKAFLKGGGFKKPGFKKLM